METISVGLPITNVTYERILKSTAPVYAWSVYSFYCWKSLQDKTNYVFATTDYVSEKLNCSKDKIIKAKKVLIGLGLIENFQRRNKESTKIIGNYIKVNFLTDSGKTWSGSFGTSTSGNGKRGVAVLCDAEKCPTYLKTTTKEYLKTTTNSFFGEKNEKFPKIIRKRRIPPNQNEILLAEIEKLKKEIEQLQPKQERLKPVQLEMFEKPQLITPNLFEDFWKLYPRKTNKGNALSCWLKLCNDKNKVSIKPTWEVVRNAVGNQRKSQLWVQKPDRIPHASTWLNNFGWLNNADEMIVYTSTAPKNGHSYAGVTGNKIEYTKPITM